MKKICNLLMTVILFFTVGFTHVHAAFTFSIDEQTFRSFDGVIHQELTVTMSKNSSDSNQVINVLSGNPLNKDDLHIIVGDNYHPKHYSMSPLKTIATMTDNRYDHYTVLGGINGDFYNMHTGIPVEAYVRNGEVISAGLGYNRDVIGFKDNGEVIIGRPCFKGFEVRIFDENGRERIELPVSRINHLPSDLTQVTVYFENYVLDIPSELHKFVIEGTNIKRDAYDTHYFGKGTFESVTTDEINVSEGTFVVVTENRYFKDIIQPNDTVRVQEILGCEFEDVNWAIGTYGKLVENGKALSHIPHGTAINSRAPRTAIGVQPDGTVFFITVDGRQSSDGKDGVTLYELGDIMETLGAEVAYNLDGGGSTTMVVRDDTTIDYVNSPSDPGGPRSLSNAIFFVKGYHQLPPPPHDLPDLSEALPIPENIHVDDNQMLQWNHVANRIGYQVKINTETLNTLSRLVTLEHLEPGVYSIQVKTRGEAPFYRDSEFSEVLTYIVYPTDLNHIYNTLKRFGRQRILE